MIGLFQRFFLARKQDISQLAAQIAERAIPTATRRLQARIVAMPAAEARGYVRARTADLVTAEAFAMLEKHSEHKARRHEVVQLARDLLADTLVAEIPRTRAHLARRHAA